MARSPRSAEPDLAALGGLARLKHLWTLALLVPLTAGAQSLPTAAQVAGRITAGWNIGNSMEVPGGETGWGNPAITQQLIDGVKAAGFDAVRIPCAWDSHANATTHQIDAAWLARVKQVVDYCVGRGLYVVLNIHWDGGWLENHPTSADQAAVNEKQKAYWTQIAEYLKAYDEHLLFAGTNEVNAGWAAPTAENLTVQQSYNQTFVDAVRATGGNNATRPLVVQTYSTNIGYGLDSFTLPRDTAPGRLIVEVHFYDPWDYTANASGSCLYWGAPYPTQSACTWGQESWIDDRFSKARAKWVDHGVPVIVGEYGVMRRTALTGQQLADHLASRQYYLEYVNAAAAKNGLKTFYWDNGVNTKDAMALLDRSSGAVVDRGGVDAILRGAGAASRDLTVSRAGTGSGTVTSSPSGVSCGATCTARFPSGTSVTVTAAADSGSIFTGWGGACTGAGSCTVSMTAARSVTATFEPAPVTTFALEVARTGTGTGTVASSPAGLSCGASCSASFPAGTSVTLTATAAGGSTFGGWSGACNGTGTCAVSMTAGRRVTATFTASSGGTSSGGTSSGGGPVTTHALEVTRTGAGRGTVTSSPPGISCGEACRADFSDGAPVTLTATAAGGSTFAGWSGDCAGTEACTLSATGARSVTARFETVPAGEELFTVPATGCASGGGGGGFLLLAPPVLALLLRRARRRR